VIVIDASVAIELLLRTAAGRQLERGVLAATETLHAPHLLDLEVTQVLRRYLRVGELSVERGNEALQDLLDLPLNRYPHHLFLPRIWGLRDSATAYDAAYLALAESLAAPLLTHRPPRPPETRNRICFCGVHGHEHYYPR
jgi:predicted nucleic acid-binding protein